MNEPDETERKGSMGTMNVPIRSANESVPPANCPIQLCTHAEINQLHLAAVCEKHVLPLYVTMNHLVLM